MHAGSSSTKRLVLPGCPDPKRWKLWPGILLALATSLSFSVFKFVVIGEIALTAETARASMPLEWLRVFIDNMPPEMPLSEAVGQALSAVFTLGILVGFAINAPLAGAWRVQPLYLISCLGMLAMAFVPLAGGSWPWFAALGIGGTYGIACAARGKSIPLLAAGSGRSDTHVSGLVNAGLVVGLLLGTVTGSNLAKFFIGDPANKVAPTMGAWIDADWIAHAILGLILLLSAASCAFVRIPEEPPTPFLKGMKDLFATTARMVRRYAGLLIGGGIAWGIMAALAITAFIYAVKVLHIDLTVAWMPALTAGVGAIVGSIVSYRFTRRRWVVGGYALFALLIGGFPFIVVGNADGSPAGPGDMALMCMMTFLLGGVHMIPTNVVDARFLAIVGEQGEAGTGSTVFSMVHNVFILLIGSGMAVLLFTGVIDVISQFYFLGVISLCAAVICAFSRVRE